MQRMADQYNMLNSSEFAAVLGLDEPALGFTAAGPAAHISQQLGSSSGLQLPASTTGAAAGAGGPCDTAAGAGAPHMLPLAPPYHHQQGQGQGQQHHWNPEAQQVLQPPSLVQFQPPWSAHTSTTLQPPALLPLQLSMADPLNLNTEAQQPYTRGLTQRSPPPAAGDAVTYGGGGGMGGCFSAAAAAAGGGGLLLGVTSRAKLLQVTNACLHSLLDMRLALLMVPAQASTLQGARAHLLA